MKSINLKFKNSTVALAGNPYGKNVFNNQVMPCLDGDDDTISIVFPDQITFVTSSFVQGFFDFWLRTMSTEEIKKKVAIEAGNDRVKNYIWANLE